MFVPLSSPKTYTSLSSRLSLLVKATEGLTFGASAPVKRCVILNIIWFLSAHSQAFSGRRLEVANITTKKMLYVVMINSNRICSVDLPIFQASSETCFESSSEYILRAFVCPYLAFLLYVINYN